MLVFILIIPEIWDSEISMHTHAIRTTAPTERYCGEEENRWWGGRGDKGTENTGIMGEIPRNHSFRGWQISSLSLPSPPVQLWHRSDM